MRRDASYDECKDILYDIFIKIVLIYKASAGIKLAGVLCIK